MSTQGSERLKHPVDLPENVETGDGANDRVAEQIRELRKAKNVTLQDLADKAKLSVGYLSQVERGRSQLSVANLLRISRALDVHLNWFFQGAFEAPAEERDVVVRAHNRRTIRFPGLGLTEELLSPSLTGPLELVVSVLEPGGDTGEPYTHKGHEAGVVVAGELELWIGEKYYRLHEGDSFSFPSTAPHRCRNPGETETKVVWIITPPSY